jgi:hypothetical protein
MNDLHSAANIASFDPSVLSILNMNIQNPKSLKPINSVVIARTDLPKGLLEIADLMA